jgi:hypothetical protein
MVTTSVVSLLALIAPLAQMADDEDVSSEIARFRRELHGRDRSSMSMNDATLAVATEWVRLRDSVDDGRFGKKADYFLGYLSGRFQVSPPAWWSRGIRRGGATRGKPWGFDDPQMSKHWKQTEGGLHYSGFDQIALADTDLTLKLGSEAVVLAKSNYPEVGTERNFWKVERFSAIVGTIGGGVSVVGFECPVISLGGPAEIYCVDLKSGQPLWKRTVGDGLQPGVGYSGGFRGSFTQIEIDDERIMVWLGHDMAMCLEVFRKKDGKRIANFHSSFLDDIHLAGWKETAD